ncbi:glutathione S-transferase zeta class-like isoform X1 [Prunus avium]|uniref:glutathione transferase n=1 Tax=Prunus avium TaxID=42229 RepID=A0A6P5RBL7_PRUAV|nr:glutathione S-transferase zeta class-like isoform X1 [Prunus avium]XP_021833969.1 glutathione S-transferase zeta class-like isoform X1 [Prunus avium]
MEASSEQQKKSENSSSSSSSKLLLYSYWQSSCSWRVRFALSLKGLPYEYKPVNITKGEQFSPDFKRLNPLHFVPVLVDGDIVVSDSYAILLYLEDKYPQRPLLPADPRLKALNLQAASIINSNIQPLHMVSLLKHLEEKVGPEESLSFAQLNIEKGLLALEMLLKDFASRYATGDEVYMADVFLAPQIVVSTTRFNINMSKFPTLSRLYESYKILPELEASSPERQPDAVH